MFCQHRIDIKSKYWHKDFAFWNFRKLALQKQQAEVTRSPHAPDIHELIRANEESGDVKTTKYLALPNYW